MEQFPDLSAPVEPHGDYEPREMKLVCLADLPEEERKKLCRPEQLDKDGNYRIPKVLKKARERGFDCPLKMNEADKKAEETEKKSLIDNLTQRSKVLEEHAREVESQLDQTKKDFEEYKRLTEARFDKLANIITALRT